MLVDHALIRESWNPGLEIQHADHCLGVNRVIPSTTVSEAVPSQALSLTPIETLFHPIRSCQRKAFHHYPQALLISSYYIKQDSGCLKEPPSPPVKRRRVQQERRKTARQRQFPCSVPTMAFFTHSLALTLHFKTLWDDPRGRMKGRRWRAAHWLHVLRPLTPTSRWRLPPFSAWRYEYPSGLKEESIIRCLGALLLVHFRALRSN